jgi:hypothetical protein
MVVFAHSAVFMVREKTTLRAALRMSAKGWSVAAVIAPAMPSHAVRPITCAYALSRKSSCAASAGSRFSGTSKQKSQKSVPSSARRPSSE